MADINPFEQPPVFEESQVVTFLDLHSIKNGYIYQYHNTPWYNFKKRWMLRVGVSVVSELLYWLENGKPSGGNIREGENHVH